MSATARAAGSPSDPGPPLRSTSRAAPRPVRAAAPLKPAPPKPATPKPAARTKPADRTVSRPGRTRTSTARTSTARTSTAGATAPRARAARPSTPLARPAAVAGRVSAALGRRAAVATRRAPFVLLVVALLVATTLGLLFLNTAIAVNSLQATALREANAERAEDVQRLEQQVIAGGTPAQLAAAATAAGLVPAGAAAYLVIGDDGTATLRGAPAPAADPAAPEGGD
ncbi:hypothetical protein [Geodermatophilus ruber]|uniref:Cell division protein FtsL n=1 Tax=Geodermatophilus ruber TaxID=504800 RepID=A0A1I4B072_9ACTN|nr:hypothetical protein [Geodermatophilus ruber]SFK61481.1 hypothetical protein SAMN04488085_102460 [Geodermatophilus ruber]